MLPTQTVEFGTDEPLSISESEPAADFELTPASPEEVAALMNSESLYHDTTDNTEFIETNSNRQQSPRGSRGTTFDIEPNNSPKLATYISDTSGWMEGSISSGSDVDWFNITLHYEFDNPLYTEQTLTLSLKAWKSGDPGDVDENFQVSIFGPFDINQNKKIDFDSELIFMAAENYRIGSPTGPIVTINSFNTGLYYIRLRTDNARANYEINYNVVDIGAHTETNQDLKHSKIDTLYVSESSPYYDRVYIHNDTFDWFRVSKNPPSKAIGLNFSLNTHVDSSLSSVSQSVDGQNIQFVTVLNILVYHEDKIGTGNKPVVPFQFRDHIRISVHSYSTYDREIEYSDTIMLPTHLFKNTYLGFYVESYGIISDEPDKKLYPVISNIGDYTRGWVTYTIEKAETETVKRPELIKVSVKSTTTNSIFGRTYDNYKYSVVYKQPDNLRPISTQISVFTIDGEVRESMVKVSKKTGGDFVFRDGCKYEFTFSGLLLGEGNNHVFQLHFKDKDSWAIGSFELGKSWHGPYISNNIRPYVRPTAPENITLYEDDNTTFFDLNNIFEDADVKEELNYSIAKPELNRHQAVWGKTYTDDILEVNIQNQTRLRIDLLPNKFGESKIWLNVTDKNHYYLEDPFEFSIIVLPVNDAPIIIQYFNYLLMFEDEVNTEINLYNHFDDPIDFDELTFRADNNRNIDVQINDVADVTLIPKQNWHGTEYINFYASDGIEEVTDYLKVIVRPLNDVPSLLIDKEVEFWEDQWANFTIDAFDLADQEPIIIGQNLTEIFPVLENKPEQYGYTFDNTTGYLTFKPTNSMVGVYSWNITAIDINNALNYTNVNLTIHNVNDPPVPTILFPENGARYLTTDKISFRGTVYDPDRSIKTDEIETITFTWYSTLHGERRKIGVGPNLPPDLYDAGAHTVTLVVDDGEIINNATIVVNVFEIDPNLDTDGDDIPDYWENLFNLNVKDPRDADDDFDSDTYSNWEEYKAQTEPRNGNSFPEKHIYRETTSEENISTYIGMFTFLVIIMVILFLFMIIKTRRRKREEKEKAEAERISLEAQKKAEFDKKSKYGKYKAPKVVCHVCGASFEVMTLNRPVAVTCNQCSSRGVIY
jgi:hypothetical protein